MAPHQVAVGAALFVPIWLLAGYTFNLSLCTSCGTGTSVSSNTVISSTTSLWALLISVLVLNEKASIPKLASVIVSCVGAALIAGQDKGESSVMGDGVCLVSAILFGLCSVLLKKFAPEEGALNMPMFFGFLGLFHTIICIPLLFLLHSLGIETYEPPSDKLLAFLTANAVFGTVLSNVLWAKAIVLTSPLIVNLGTSTSIPLSFLADYLNPHANPPNMEFEYLLGAVLVTGSFVLVSFLEAAGEEAAARPCTPRLMSGACTPGGSSSPSKLSRAASLCVSPPEEVDGGDQALRGIDDVV